VERDSGGARLTGPIRCRKRGPGKPIPDSAPRVAVLPPTDPAHFAPPPELERIRICFEAADYRACVEPIEELFFARRNTFHQGLLQYVVVHLQLPQGRLPTLRRLLTQVLELWRPYPDWQEGVDVAAARQHARRLLAAFPVDRETLSAEEIAALPAPPAL